MVWAYHLPMRRAMFVCLIFIVLLRGMLGTAMAMGNATSTLGATPQHCMTSGPASATAMHDHQAHAAQPDSSHAQHTAAAHCHDAEANQPPCNSGMHAHGASCAACDICHSAMLAPVIAADAMQLPPSQPPPGHSAIFASVLPAQLSKPPIL